ncbi:conserved Plasmodium protein, unknown function [Plasmodium berghei]|uniref:Uncharacterized protein n=2 Tax=Plasmodium berghei TaxID=5821 RepID=A0A509ALE9_PLABA|nr:conserved protein, unknown function [Plasmodium berghei ANKA]CXI37103.1 conserved Plasmodium protein, unknown function [Plasmodium berghei]SCM21645.1 conserved Plasmodium protein, unknown function [Plasmodium berghei]SCN24845.1 conserved Plasmodium protein, unknown function [Plasmodium berghei]SCO59962.1 conserved Plasmodium protein, unknown function [Plasmodium berghei]SCO61339.1 conserved Plasmodium protein, unknown function [Plasmodium berghei]|eukprot:XP_034421324.1 conserved protein, unknown function [Plasmodium berghei ANKA]
MQYNLILNKINTNYVIDPYVSMLYIKRAYKYLHFLKKNNGNIVTLGNKYNEIKLENYFENKIDHKQLCDLNFLTNSTKKYDLLICTDIPLYYKYIKNIFIPKMFVGPGSEFVKNKNYLHIFDYFIPLTNQKLDIHLHYILQKRYLSSS